MPRSIYIQLHLLIALFATTAIIGRLASFSAPGLVIWRTSLAALGAAVLVVAMRPQGDRFPGVGRVLRLVGIGCLVGLHWMCFFGAIKLANISICLAGMATTTFFTAFSEPLLDRRMVRPVEVVLGLLVLSGLLLVAGFEHGFLAGLGVALLGAMLAAIFPVLNRHLVNQGRMDPLVMVVWEMVGACLICLVTLPWLDGAGAYGRLLEFRGLDWLWVLLLAWLCTVFAHAFHIRLLRYMSAYTGSMAGNLEPVYGIIAAAVLFQEHRQLHPGFFIGTATILLANIAHPLTLSRLTPPEKRISPPCG